MSALPVTGAGPCVALVAGASLLRGFARSRGRLLEAEIEGVLRTAPLRHMLTPAGRSMSVAMSNCGSAGWVTDRGGYRYERHDPASGRPWPPMPSCFRELAREAAARGGFEGFDPDACLINCYAPGARMSLHQDRDERDLAAPIVSVSLGLPAIFLLGGERRSDRPQRIVLEHGDVLVWGGPARLRFHGVLPVAPPREGTAAVRFNLTLRKAF